MDTASRRLGLYVAIGGLMVVLDTTVVIVALPGLIRDFHTDLATVQWLTTGYVLGIVTVMPVGPWISQRFGARRVYLAAIAIFTLGSLLTGCAWDVGSLIGFRVLQGAGGGLINPVGMSIALAAVPPGRRGAMMSLLGIPVLIGPLAGPLVAGLLIDQASWRWIFWINVPVGLASMVMGRRVLPGQATGRVVGRFDLVGLLLLSPGIGLIVFGLSEAGRADAVTSRSVWLPVLSGALCVGGFVQHVRAVDAPLLRLQVLRIRSMAAGTATLMLFAAAYFGSAVIGPAFVQIVRGDSATVTGAIGLPQALATGLSLQVATRLSDRVQPRRIVGVGISIAVAGTLARVAVLTPHTNYAWLTALGGVTGLGIGATMSPTMTAATRSLSGSDLTAASTVLNLSSQTATALGTALASTVLALFAVLFAPGLGSGGISNAARLPGPARQAFTVGLGHAAQCALAATAALMLLALLTSRMMPDETAMETTHAGDDAAGRAQRPDESVGTPTDPPPGNSS